MTSTRWRYVHNDSAATITTGPSQDEPGRIEMYVDSDHSAGITLTLTEVDSLIANLTAARDETIGACS